MRGKGKLDKCAGKMIANSSNITISCIGMDVHTLVHTTYTHTHTHIYIYSHIHTPTHTHTDRQTDKRLKFHFNKFLTTVLF